MNKDKRVAVLDFETSYGQDIFRIIDKGEARFPYGFRDVNNWIDSRSVAKHRKHIAQLIKLCQMETRSGFLDMTRGLSLNDTFWVKKCESDFTWDDVSLYKNPFDDVISRIAFDGVGMRGGRFSSTSPEFSTEGNFEKCWIRQNDEIFLIKRGTEGAYNAGNEPYSEVLASQLATAFNVDHVAYELVDYHNKLSSKCRLFTDENTGFISMNSYAVEKGRETIEIEDVVNFCKPYEIQEDFFRMIVFDALIFNVDRHLGNYGFLVNNDTGSIIKFAPLFDHNLSLLPYLTEEDDIEGYLSGLSPRIGTDFIETAKLIITKSIRADLINLNGFKFKNPGYDYPDWKLNLLNGLLERNIRQILGQQFSFSEYDAINASEIKEKEKPKKIENVR